MFKVYRLVESHYKIIRNGKIFDMDQLTSNNIFEDFNIIELIVKS